MNKASFFCLKRRTLPFVRNEQRFQNRYSNISQFRAYDRFLCSQSLHGIVRNQEKNFSSLRNVRELETITYQTNNAAFCCWKRTTFPYVVRNEQRFKNLHGVVGNKERFSDKNFLNVVAYKQSEILIFSVFVSSGLTFFFGRHN